MNKENKVFLFTGIILFLTEIIKQYTLTTYYGHYIWWNFPFQLCSIAMYLCLILPFIKNEFFRSSIVTFLMTFSLMGGICAFFDTTGMHYIISWLTVHSYSWHFVLIILGIYAGHITIRRDTIKTSFASAFSIYGICVILAEVFNLCFDRFGEINMFYINPHYQMSQVVFDMIAEKTSNTCGIVFYICCSVIGAYIFYSIWKCIRKAYRTH